MREALQQLGRIPGVVASAVCGPGGDLLASDFQPPLAELDLRQVASLMARDLVGLKALVGEGGALDLRYSRGRAVMKPFRFGTLFVLCRSAINPQLLTLSLEQVSRKLEAGASTVERSGEMAAEIAELREGLSLALLRQIGPVGEIIFAEAWNRWAVGGVPSRAGLGELTAEVAREVDDAQARARFLGEAGDVIQRWGRQAP
jgi:hypothetical protein